MIAPSAATPRRRRIPPWVHLVFALSGFAALLYQVVWQRALFNIYGINLESVTVVVTAFMLGLGLGSLAGGAISRRAKVPLLCIFGAMELGIGLFGLLSLQLFRWVGHVTLQLPLAGSALVTLALLLLPTLLMGATLPLLVTHAVRLCGNVGRSVGALYFVNTLGSAVAAAAAVLWLMGPLGLSGTVLLAASLNLLSGAAALVLTTRRREPS